jgi:tetrahydromethanopterin S-methyltransferase subunit G
MELNDIAILLESIDSKVQITMEAVAALDKKIDTKVDELRVELKHDIAVVDSKVMGLSKRLDAVEERLSNEIADVRNDLAAHRNNTELHHAQPKRPLKRA